MGQKQYLEIMLKSFPKLTKYINPQIEEILQAQTSQIQGKTHLEMQYKLRTKEKEKNTKSSQRRRNPFLEYPKAILGQVCEKITNEDLYHSIVCGARGWRKAIWSPSQWDKINKISGFPMKYDEAVRSN